MSRLSRHPFFIRLFHWEYWPFYLVYSVPYLYWIWLCIKARSFFFFSLSNPAIKNGGMLMESKKQIYDLLPPSLYPRTQFFKAGASFDQVKQQLSEQGYSFPLIGKPDIGMRGLAVQVLNTWNEVALYVSASKTDFLIQEYSTYPHEAGIFYYRLPGEENGHISGMVQKEFLSVEGDGTSSLYQLLCRDKRYILQLKPLQKIYGKQLEEILPAGTKRTLSPYGNHARGAKFTNAGQHINDSLIQVMNNVCRQIKGFYFGRLDVRFQSWQELKEGKNFSIIEVNGAGSEPAHIYDPKHSLWYAWKEIIRHWALLYKISSLNRKRIQEPYMSFRSGIQMFRDNFQHIKILNGRQ